MPSSVCGLLLVCLTRAAIVHHNEQIKAGRWEKYYLARVAAPADTDPATLLGEHRAYLKEVKGRAVLDLGELFIGFQVRKITFSFEVEFVSSENEPGAELFQQLRLFFSNPTDQLVGFGPGVNPQFRQAIIVQTDHVIVFHLFHGDVGADVVRLFVVETLSTMASSVRHPIYGFDPLASPLTGFGGRA